MRILEKFYLLLSSILCFWTLGLSEQQQNSSPIEMLYLNRTHAAYLKLSMFNKNKDSSFSIWKKNESDLITTFNLEIPWTIKNYGGFRYYLQDSISVSILASLLDFPDYRQKPKPRDSSKQAYWDYVEDMQNYHEKDWVRDALNYLTYQTYFSSLSPHFNEIKRHLQNCKEPEMIKINLFALCNLSGKEKDSLLKDEDEKIKKDQEAEKSGNYKKHRPPEEIMPLWVRVSLGDTVARKKMLNTLNKNDNDYDKNMEAARAASVLWDDSCKIAFFNLFNRNIYKNLQDYQGFNFCYSIHDSLLLLLARHHPNEPLFGEKLNNMRNPMEYCDPPFQAGYFKEFATWVKKTYNFDITYEGFMPYFKIDCSSDKSAIRKTCK